jgi:hypothetical protein
MEWWKYGMLELGTESIQCSVPMAIHTLYGATNHVACLTKREKVAIFFLRLKSRVISAGLAGNWMGIIKFK